MTKAVASVEDLLVKHDLFQNAVTRVEKCFNMVHEGAAPVCIALIGESRTGKSTVLETFLGRHPAEELNDGWRFPILRVSTPSKPTVKGLAEVLLDAFDREEKVRGTENELTRRVRVLMRNTGVKMLMIDEFQHFFDKGTRAVMHHVADWLKLLVDAVGCSLVVAGLESCQAVIEQNEQLKGRFQAPIRMARFDWLAEKDCENFKRTLRAFGDELQKQFDIPALDSHDMAFRVYCATGGLMGYVSSLMRQVVCNATIANARCIKLEDLAIAHEESIWQSIGSHKLPKPFARGFVPDPRNAALIQLVQQIGVAVNPASVSAGAGRKSLEPKDSINQILTKRK
jgi:hypothetical protein